MTAEAAPEERPSPLEGLVVLDIGTMIAGPLAATLLGDFGAEVIKVEHPRHGDPMRSWSPMKEGKSLWWKVIGRNKKLITLDLSKPKGREILLRLVERADVVVENFRPGTMERWGLGFEELQRANPRVVLVRVSGYGQTGPYSRRPGYGTVAEAMTGIPAMTGTAEGPPTLPPVPMGDSVAAVFGAMSTMFALYYRDRNGNGNGRGQVIDVSLYEPLFRLAESMVIGYDQLGIVKQRMGNRLAEDSPRNAYETSDGEWVALSASNERSFQRLVAAIGQPDLVDDARFKDNPSRIAHADDLDEILASWFKERRLEAVLAHLDACDVVVGPIYDVERIFADSHYAAREDIVEVTDPDFGTVKMQAAIPKLSDTPGSVRWPGLEMGRANREILEDSLGLSGEQLALLHQEGVI